MKNQQFVDIIKQGHLVIPLYFLKNYKKLKLTLEEFIFLMYLYQLGDKSIFNPSKYQEELQLDLPKIIQTIHKLTRSI